MKKLLAVLAVLLMITGCSSQASETKNLKSELDGVVSAALNITLPGVDSNNAHKVLYNYYLPRGVGREERNSTSNLFIIYGNRAILNLDIAGILSSSLYHEQGLREIEELASKDYEKAGILINSAGQEKPYRIVVKKLDEKDAYIITQTSEFMFTVTCPILETDETLYEMIKILRTCQVESEKVIAEYSVSNNASTGSKIIRLFNEILPESGYIRDYIDDWKNDPTFTIIDRTIKPADIPSLDDLNNEENGFEDAGEEDLTDEDNE